MTRVISVVFALLSLAALGCHGCNKFGQGEGASERRLQASLRSGAPKYAPPPAILGSPAKLISQISDAIFNPEDQPSQESARSSVPQFATYGEDPDQVSPFDVQARSDDLDVSPSESKEISNILAQLGDAPNNAAAAVNATFENGEQLETELNIVDGCCWKIKVDHTSGHGFYGPVQILKRIFGYYTMEPGLVNGKVHYTSSDTRNKGLYALSFCGDSWWLQPAAFRGQCKGFAHSGWHEDNCVTDIAYSWVYYVPTINQFVTAKKAMSTWCHV